MTAQLRPFQTKDWLVKIRKNRTTYTTAARGVNHPRYKVPKWKRRIICTFPKVTRELADQIGKFCKCSAGYVYQIRREEGITRPKGARADGRWQMGKA